MIVHFLKIISIIFQISEGQVFDSFPCITWQMPSEQGSVFTRSITWQVPVLLFFLVLLGIFVTFLFLLANVQLISITSKSLN